MIRTYCARGRDVAARSRSSSSRHDPATGGVDLADLEQRLSTRTAAVLFDNPSLPRRASSRARRRSRRSRAATAPRRSSASTRSRSASSTPPSELRRRHRRRQHPAARRPHDVRRRRRRLHRHAATRRATPTSTRRFLLSISETVAGRARLRDRPVRADLVRQPRGGQRLDGQLGLPVGGRERRLPGADGPGGLRARSAG